MLSRVEGRRKTSARENRNYVSSIYEKGRTEPLNEREKIHLVRISTDIRVRDRPPQQLSCFMIPMRERGGREGGRKSGFCGRAPTARNARGPDSLPIFIKIPRALGKKRNIRATQSVSPVPYVALRPLLLWLPSSTFSPAFASSPFLTVLRRGVLSPWPLASRTLAPSISFVLSFSVQLHRPGRNLLRRPTRRRSTGEGFGCASADVVREI